MCRTFGGREDAGDACCGLSYYKAVLYKIHGKEQAELEPLNRVEGNPYLYSVEELYYYRIFKKTLPHPSYDRQVGPFQASFLPRHQESC